MAIVDTTCLLKISNSGDLLKFLHLCVDDIIGKNKINFDNFNNEIELTKEELKKAQNYIQTLYKNLVNHGDTFDLKADLHESILEALRKCFEVRKEDLQNHIKKENIIRTNLPLVQNIDWKVKWVIGSSAFATLSEPLLQIDLHCSSKESGQKSINFEMSYEQVECMIEELEKIKVKCSK